MHRPCLSQVNPDVFPLLFFNAVGWTIYSGCTHNPYLFASVFFNVMAGMFYTLNAYQLAESDAARRRIELVMVTLLGVWSAVGFAAPQIPDKQLRNNLVGSTATVVSLLLFSSPLSTVTTVRPSIFQIRPYSFQYFANKLLSISGHPRQKCSVHFPPLHKRFRGGLVFKAHRLSSCSSYPSQVILLLLLQPLC